MKRIAFWFLIMLLLATGLATQMIAGCGDDDDDDDDNDDDNDDNDDSTGDDDDSADDDDDDDDNDTVLEAWEQRCESFVNDMFDICSVPGLFDLDRDEAKTNCKAHTPMQLPWDCVMECWEIPQDCTAWFTCIMDDCGLVPPDDDDDDDDNDDNDTV
jgi:hypothetical protein